MLAPDSGGGGHPGSEPSVRAGDGLAGEDAADQVPEASEAFQRLASDVRVAVLRELLAAERAGDAPLSFSELHERAPADTSAGFAYHLRQLDGHFVTAAGEGYRLTEAGRAAARLVDSGALLEDAAQAS